MYIGSTTKELLERFSNHCYDYKYYSLDSSKGNFVSSYILFDEFGVENCQIHLLEFYPCVEKTALRRREGEYIEQLECVNRFVAGRTKVESDKHYYERNKVKLRQARKDYYKENQEKLKEQSKTWRKENRERKKQNDREYRETHREEIKEYKKEYYKNNKESINEQRREFYEANKEKIKERARGYYHANKQQIRERIVKLDCPCGGTYTTKHRLRHSRAKMHLKWLEENKTSENQINI